MDYTSITKQFTETDLGIVIPGGLRYTKVDRFDRYMEVTGWRLYVVERSEYIIKSSVPKLRKGVVCCNQVM